jgi:hypothetical protein
MKYRYQTPDKTANGKVVTTLLNSGVRSDSIAYIPQGDGRWLAWHLDESLSCIAVIYTPGEFSYFRDIIMVNDRLVTITGKTYKQIIRKLSEHQIMQKLES